MRKSDVLAHAVPVSERIGLVYMEHARFPRDAHGLIAEMEGDMILRLPIGRTVVLMLGPGCSITHAAVALSISVE